MGLSYDTISQFVKVTNDKKETTKKETITYGTVDKTGTGVILDGTPADANGNKSAVPAKFTVTALPDERVVVMIRDHSVVVTANLNTKSTTEAGAATVATKTATETVNEVIKPIVEANVVITGRLDAAEAAIDQVEADNIAAHKIFTEDIKALKGQIEDLDVENLEAKYAKIEDVEANYATINELNAKTADVSKISGIEADISDIKADNVEINNTLKTTAADIEALQTDKLDATSGDIRYANIDFANIGEAAIKKILADSGLIKDIVVGNGTITGKLVGVTISGDLIEGNTIVAEKLVVKGEDGLYYKLNTDGVTTEAEQTDYNSLNGSVIKAKSITATQISVDDLVAFDATLGGFNITAESLYSGAKSSVDNTTQGIYLDSKGQMAIGDSNNFIKYYKDQNGVYKLAISAASIIFASSNKSVETAIDDVQNSIDNLEIGGRNLALGSANNYENPSFNQFASTISGIADYEITSETYNSMRIARWSGSSTSKWSGPFFGINGKLKATLTVGETYVISAWMKADVATSISEVSFAEGQTIISYQKQVNTEWTRVWVVFTATEVTKNVCIYTAPNATAEAPYIYMCGIKLEKGNKATDWTPAPEDMATSEEVDKVKSSADEAQEKADNATALIAQLKDSISMLVTDGNGTSLMTQTEDGWTFSTADIQTKVNTVSENLAELTTEVDDTTQTVNILQQAVDDLGIIAEYVKITTYEDEPCIELGEGDSEFKLRITNTRMMFTEGSSVLAYFNNKSLHIKKAVVEEELQQGNFVWKVRSNGNMGCVWKGGTS